MTYLLDTSVIIDALNGKKRRDVLLKNLVTEGHMLACCAINITEVYAGLRPTDEERTEELLRSLEYCEITWDIAKTAGLLKREYARKGTPLSVPDAIIASVALTHNLTLITDNTKDYPMPGLRLYPLIPTGG